MTYSLAERPDLRDAFWSIDGAWPRFMLQDPTSETAYAGAVEAYPELHLVVLDGALPVARLHAVPITWPGLDGLPARGWDWAMQTAEHRALTGDDGDRGAVSLIEARIAPDRRGEGLSGPLLAEARRRFADLGTRDLVAPVRPMDLALEPWASPDEYARRARSDGLPADRWLRVHARLGATVVAVCPLSMTIPGTLAQWREWTGLPFAEDGPTEVPGALAPVHVDLVHDHAVYVEPNVWVHHDLR